MYQPSVLPTAVSSDLAESWQQTLADNRLRTLRALGVELSLPGTVRTFLLFLLAIVIIGAGLTMHILLSMQLWQTTIKIEQLQASYRAIEQQNSALIWSIAQQSTLASVSERAAALGYAVALHRHYVPVADPRLVATAGDASHDPATSILTSQPVALAAAPLPPASGREAVQAQAGEQPPLASSTSLFHSLGEWWKRHWQKFVRN